MSAFRSALHTVRDRVVALSTYREFNPIDKPRNCVVVVRPDHFGDMLMLAPAMNWLKEYVSDDELILMTGPWNRSIAEHIAAADHVVTYPFPGFTRESNPGSMLAPYRAIPEAASTLRNLAPRAVVLARDDHWWGAWMAREAGAPLRLGYANRQVAPFLTHPMEIIAQHYVEQNFDLLARSLSVLGYQIPSPDDPRRDLRMAWPIREQAANEARDLLGREVSMRGFAVIHPGSGAPVKLWPGERWATVADCIARESGLQIVLTGSPDEAALGGDIESRSESGVVNLVGKTSLFVLAEVIRQARVILGVDSGPLHLATAVGTRSIALFGPSDHRRYGPWGDPERHRVVSAEMRCPRCGDLSPRRPTGCGCMMGIMPEQVTNAAIEVLEYDG